MYPGCRDCPTAATAVNVWPQVGHGWPVLLLLHNGIHRQPQSDRRILLRQWVRQLSPPSTAVGVAWLFSTAKS
ncbi:hypothetical protein Lalb_Chr14g0375951 [Lupinus albus]|uniref:Uncharacterized protein n=1 Tax=Lupinus albus TaxID=3870 RepID=A0A6A4PGX5_LUPAL|nr:hypothetical protein Lalb_Chr14g0375951 [Lupinus albus]